MKQFWYYYIMAGAFIVLLWAALLLWGFAHVRKRTKVQPFNPEAARWELDLFGNTYAEITYGGLHVEFLTEGPVPFRVSRKIKSINRVVGVPPLHPGCRSRLLKPEDMPPELRRVVEGRSS